MAIITPEMRLQIDQLTDWWEGAGVPVDRRQIERLLREAETQSAPVSGAAVLPIRDRNDDNIDQARKLARAADTLDALHTAIAQFDGSDLKKTCKKTVIADGVDNADIMVIGEGPGRDEDLEGKPFVGRAGQLLDKMLASIGLSRDVNTNVTNVNYWRPPGNRNPTDHELAICRPFLDRHIALVKPRIIIATGAVPAKALLNVADGIMKLRGNRFSLQVPDLKDPIPLFPIFHPAYLLRRPGEKARAWADLLGILSHLEQLGIAPEKRP